MRDGNSHDEDDAELDERVEALFDLLVAAGTDSTANVALDEFSQLLSTFAMNDLPDEPQPYDRSVERLVAVLETCRSMDEDDIDDESVQSQKAQIQGRISTGKDQPQTQERRFFTGSPPSQPPKVQEVQLQDQFDQEHSSTAYPKIGPGYSDTISVASDLTEEDVSIVSESNLSSAAKIKYTFGSVARTLKNDTDAPKLLRKEENRLNWSSLDASLKKKPGPALSKSPQSSVTPKLDTLLIDEVGFIFHGEGNNDRDPFMTAAAPPGTFEGSFQQSDRKREKSASTPRRRESTGRGSMSSTPRSSTHNRSREGTDEVRARRRDSAKGSSTSRSSTHKRRHGSRNRSQDEREEARARRRGSAKGSSSAPRNYSRHRARDGSGSRSHSSNKASRMKKRESSRSHHHEAKSVETATTSLSTTADYVKGSRINGVEAATKQRIEVLRKLVKQTTSDDDALNTKLDFVEQIAKLRDRLGDGRQELIT